MVVFKPLEDVVLKGRKRRRIDFFFKFEERRYILNRNTEEINFFRIPVYLLRICRKNKDLMF